MLKRSAQQIIEDLLDSDDELPTEYNEDPFEPAYQKENRFDKISFNWIDNNFSKYYCQKQKVNKAPLAALYSRLNEQVVHNKTQNLRVGEKSMILKGVLKQQDIYCLKSVEPIASDATLIWFINFLVYKDLQAKYNFLKTCLVETMHKTRAKPNFNFDYIEHKKYNFDIVLKD